MDSMLNQSFFEAPTLGQFSINLILVILLSLIATLYFSKISNNNSLNNSISSMIPLLSMIVYLVIVVIKGSLALSLGLVGALSIVRFRTPVKEPEELLHLFLAIAIGLGCGANQIMVTILGVFSILIVNYFIFKYKAPKDEKPYLLEVNGKIKNINLLKEISIIIKKYDVNADLKRIDVNINEESLMIFMKIIDIDNLSKLKEEILKIDRGLSLTFIDQQRVVTL